MKLNKIRVGTCSLNEEERKTFREIDSIGSQYSYRTDSSSTSVWVDDTYRYSALLAQRNLLPLSLPRRVSLAHTAQSTFIRAKIRRRNLLQSSKKIALFAYRNLNRCNFPNWIIPLGQPWQKQSVVTYIKTTMEMPTFKSALALGV